MPELIIDGCSTTSLAGYLSGIGLLRAVTRLLDERAYGCWSGGRFVLSSSFGDPGGLAAELGARFAPLPVVSPWNSGSGFAANGKSTTAEALLDWVRGSDDARLAELRAAVAAGDRVVETGRALGLGGTGDELWNKAHKPQILRLCRNVLPDGVVGWMDAAVALGGDEDVSYSRILGTGGNLGRLDLSATYLRLAQLVLTDPDSVTWLHAAMTGDMSVALPKESLGQFDPGGVGGPGEPNPVGNPWIFLLLVEGAVLFATAVTRRHGAEYGHAALPFQVRGSSAGFDTSAAGEKSLAELWAPEWRRPMRIPELGHLLGSGRADWNGAAAGSALDFVRAAATLGVDRGITAFHRHIFVDRLGQSPLAVYAGRIEVDERAGVGLLAPLDRWMILIERENPSNLVTARHEGLQRAIFHHARSADPAALADVFTAIGALRRAVARSGKISHLADGLDLPCAAELLAELRPALASDAELRIAFAVAAAHDHRAPTTPEVTIDALGAGLFAALADAARRRAMPGAVPDATDVPEPSVRGARIVSNRGPLLRRGDLTALVTDVIDEDRTANLIAGLATVDWRGTGGPVLSGPLPPRHDPTIDLMLQFTCDGPVRLGSDGVRHIESTLRPGFQWPALLIASRVEEVLADAAQRLRLAGVRHVVTPTSRHDGARLAAMLLLRSTPADRYQALDRIALRPEPGPDSTQPFPDEETVP